MSTGARRSYASAAFVTLLVLSVSWPSPIVSVNRLTTNAPLAVDELSFLGREAPSWDVVFWCLAGLLALIVVQSGDVRGWRRTVRAAFHWQPNALRRLRARLAGATLAAVIVVAFTWLVLDVRILIWAETIQSDTTRLLVRMANRFGGGMNPPMIVAFFGLAGIAYATPRWIRYSAAMALASLGAGMLAHVLKLFIGRTRPELWLGPFQFVRGSANSFPSGHTVSAFALAGVLCFASRNLLLRVISLILASAVGLSRILAFRHWASDVVASACLGLIIAWVVVEVTPEGSRYDSSSAKETDTRREQPASSMVTP